MNSRTLMIAALAGLYPVTAWAGGQAIIEAGDGGSHEQMQLEYDGTKVRMNMPAQSGTYTILRDGINFRVASFIDSELPSRAEL